MTRLPAMMNYEISYEHDGENFTGEIMAYNLLGHGIDLDDIELFLLDRYSDDEIEEGGWEVREDWLRKVPTPNGDSMHVYGKPGRGARAVTVLERPSGWSYWCINHPMEPAMTGRPASQIIDGEALVARRLSELAEDVDPRPDVSRDGYIYQCRECSNSFSERYAAAQRKAMEDR